jgi:hypothetical protein
VREHAELRSVALEGHIVACARSSQAAPQAENSCFDC